MKTIVVAGDHSSVGKTSLAKELCAILPDAVRVKIGTGRRNEEKEDILFPFGTPFETLRAQYGTRGFLVIESNNILNEITPDCTIFCTGTTQPKPSALQAREKADIVRGCRVDAAVIQRLCLSLDLGDTAVRRIAWLSGARPSETAAIILCGGRSSRMGMDKARLEIDGVNMLERLCGILSPLCDHCIASVGFGCNLAVPGVLVAADPAPDQGPLMGIYAALEASPAEFNFVVACDIPEISVTLLYKLLAVAQECDIAVPSFAPGQYEPLFAVYRKGVAAATQQALAAHTRRVDTVFSLCNTVCVTAPDNAWYVNLNTPRDVRAYLHHRRKTGE